jgi:hypothetical protein
VAAASGCCGPGRAAVPRGGGDREGDQEAAATGGYGLEEVAARGGGGVQEAAAARAELSEGKKGEALITMLDNEMP